MLLAGGPPPGLSPRHDGIKLVLHTEPSSYNRYALTLLTAKKMYKECTIDILEPKVTDKFAQVNFPLTCGPASPTQCYLRDQDRLYLTQPTA